MTKLRTGDPWMPAPDYGQSLTGLGINLLVREIEAALPFHREVLDAEVVYSDPDIAVLRRNGVEWMLHAHHTYDAHPWYPIITSDARRGVGAELRLHGRDPDAAESAARRLGFEIIQPATDKPHGLREAYVADHDGYVWVPDVPTA
ncbi:MAG: VOC family protein [Gammaproteobacteria bacterium]|nr:VOC family protein [Gammaproteobacteria bacterium]